MYINKIGGEIKFTADKVLSNKAAWSFFVVISGHLLPLTNYLSNGQYVKVQPIAKKFAERKYLTTSDNKWLASKILIYAK